MKRLFYSLLAISVFIVIACQKDFLQSSDVATDSEFTLATAKQHFRSLDKKLAKENPVLADPQSSELLWSRSYVAHRTNVDFAEIPLVAKRKRVKLYNFPQDSLKYEPDAAVGEQAVQRLLFYRGKNGEMHERILTYLPDKEYLTRRRAELGLNTIRKMQGNYSGYIEYSRLSGEVTLILRMEEGKIVRRYRPEGSLGKRSSVSLQSYGGCYTDCIMQLEYMCDHFIDNEDVLNLECGWEYIGTYCQTVCSNDPGDGDDGGGDEDDGGSEPEPIVYDCNGTPNGSAHMAECGCVGGNTGFLDCEDMMKITDELDSFACAQNILNTAIPNLKTNVQAKINDIFGGDEYNIKFVATDFADPDLDGKAYHPNIARPNYIIALDSTMLRNATKEYMIATMYHEILHAFLMAEESRLGSQFGIIYSGIQTVDINGTVKYRAQNSGHYLMVQFIDEIEQAIMSFNPNFPAADATALAKYGITPINSSESQINTNEKTANTNSKGQKCTN